MIKEYKSVVKAERFGGSEEMISKYHLVYGYGLDGIKAFYGPFNGALDYGDWIATGVNGEHWVIDGDIFEKNYQEVK